MKPDVTRGLAPGKALGAQRGFAATFNWMLNFCRNLSGGPGLTLDRKDPDHPIIRLASSAPSAALHPFKVAAYQIDPDDDSATADSLGNYGWKIYLPHGSLSVGDECEPINRKMSDVAEQLEGEDDAAFEARHRDWYDLALKEDTDGGYRTATETLPDGQGGTRSAQVRYYEFDVVVHAKTRARLKGVGSLDPTTRRFLYAEARPRTRPGGGEWTAAEEAANRWGDEFAQTVASIEVRIVPAGQGGTAKVERKVRQAARAAISVAGRAAEGFDLAWHFEVDDDTGKLSVHKVYCVRPSLSAAGITLSGPDMTDVTDATESVYAKIKTNPLNPDAQSGTVEVVKDPTGIRTDSDLTWLRLYSISNNRVTADWRAQSLANAQVYR